VGKSSRWEISERSENRNCFYRYGKKPGKNDCFSTGLLAVVTNNFILSKGGVKWKKPERPAEKLGGVKTSTGGDQGTLERIQTTRGVSKWREQAQKRGKA